MPYNILLGLPGPQFESNAMLGVVGCSREHSIKAVGACGSGDNFNALWAGAQNDFEAGEITHFAMQHADVAPQPLWIDTLVQEMEKAKVSLISVPIPLKDDSGKMSCGIGCAKDYATLKHQFTKSHLDRLPITFTEKDWGDENGVLLHNNGCWLADLRNDMFRATTDEGSIIAFFDFKKEIRRDKQRLWASSGLSEDWFFSFLVHKLGIPTAITTAVAVGHIGKCEWRNDQPLRRDTQTYSKLQGVH